MTDAPLSKQAEIAQGVLERMLQEMAFPATVEVVETPDQITLTMVSAESLSLLVGKGGQTLNATELLLTMITRHQTQEYGKRLVLDAEGYRGRQTDALVEKAQEAARQARETGEPVPLEPMNARDRRTVHMAIQEMEGLATFSTGEDPYRHIVVCLPGQEEAEG
jgi:spoIIIJ-associated protein